MSEASRSGSVSRGSADRLSPRRQVSRQSRTFYANPATGTSSVERRWEKITPDVRDQLKSALKAMVDPDSYWSVVTAGCVALLLSCLLLLWARPSVVLKKNTDGSVEQTRICVTRLFATSTFLALLVVGIALYFKWRRGRPVLAS